MKKFNEFCAAYGIGFPFPVSESLLCYFTAHLAGRKLSPQSIKTYLAGVRHTQISLGLPEPRAFSSLPRLHLTQTGVQRAHAQQGSTSRVRLPITPGILRQMQAAWAGDAEDPDVKMLWAAVTCCFFGFFRAGEITVPTLTAYDPKRHLSWGDVAVDDPASPKVVKVHLRFSKTDQAGRGADIYLGKTGCPLCPVAAILGYIAMRGDSTGQFFKFGTVKALPRRSSPSESGLCYAG